MSNLENANAKSAEERKRAEITELMECGIKREQQLPTLFLGVMQE